MANFLLFGSAIALLQTPSCEKAPLQPSTLACAKFQAFEEKNGKNYPSDLDRSRRYIVFMENYVELERMEERFGAKYTHLSPLADWTKDEFQTRNALKAKDIQLPKDKEIDLEKLATLKDHESWDWREQGAVNDVKDQKACGSCWAFSTVANVEGVYMHQHGELHSLSEQQLVSCDDNDNGCDGGLPAYAARWLIETKNGLESEENYPYEASVETCRIEPIQELVFVTDFGWITQGNEVAMANVLVAFGPLSIGINASPLMTYHGGIITPKTKEDCSADGIDHGVNIVAFGTEEAKPYWTIRNSWGPHWGEEGYYRMVRGEGACGIDQLVTTVTATHGENRMKQIFA